jgi:hypothetical protein
VLLYNIIYPDRIHPFNPWISACVKNQQNFAWPFIQEAVHGLGEMVLSDPVSLNKVSFSTGHKTATIKQNDGKIKLAIFCYQCVQLI